MERGTPQPVQPAPEQAERRLRLPIRITLLLILVLITTVLSAVRCLTAIGWQITLRSYAGAALAVYAAISGAIWTLAGGFVLWSVWRGRRNSRLVMLAAAGAYALWYWIDRLLIQPGAHANWRFELLVTAGLLVYTAAIVLDPHNRIFFTRERHDQ